MQNSNVQKKQKDEKKKDEIKRRLLEESKVVSCSFVSDAFNAGITRQILIHANDNDTKRDKLKLFTHAYVAR